MDRILCIHLWELVALAPVAPHTMQFSDIHEHAVITLRATVSLMPLLRRSLRIALLQRTSSLRISRVSGLVVPAGGFEGQELMYRQILNLAKMTSVRRRRLFVTRSKLIRIAPMAAGEGDLLCVL
jgi:hypothetical protein